MTDSKEIEIMALSQAICVALDRLYRKGTARKPRTRRERRKLAGKLMRLCKAMDLHAEGIKQ